MDRISGLSDDLLIQILSYLPTNAAASTSVLSKRWEYLWLGLPGFDFVLPRGSSPSKRNSFRRCLDRNLPLNRAPVLESFRLELRDSHFRPSNIKNWIRMIVASHGPPSLEIVCDSYWNVPKPKPKPNILPDNLYTCKSLVILKLSGWINLDVPRMVSLPALKTLQLNYLRYANEESLERLLSCCPVLEDLSVNLMSSRIVGKLTVDVPSLQSLTLWIAPEDIALTGIVIKTPSLKYFKLENYVDIGDLDCLVENMPDLIEAYLDVLDELAPNIDTIIGSITSVKRLTVCSKDMYVKGIVFNQLEHLSLCRCKEDSTDLLFQLLKDSPNLQELDLFIMENHNFDEPLKWEQPSVVPECMLSSLHTFNWLAYAGEAGERDLAVYFLKNTAHLKTAAFKFYQSEFTESEMVQELAVPFRAGTRCEFMYNCPYLVIMILAL